MIVNFIIGNKRWIIDGTDDHRNKLQWLTDDNREYLDYICTGKVLKFEYNIMTEECLVLLVRHATRLQEN